MSDIDKTCENCLDKISDCTCEETEAMDSDGAVCPYCGFIDLENDSEGYILDEGNDSNNCQSCGKEYNMSLHISHMWTTTRKDSNK